MKALLGIKLGMFQVWDDMHHVLPVTAIEAKPCVVAQVKTQEKDGYAAVQIASQECTEKSLTKAEIGHQQKSHNMTSKYYKELIEIRDSKISHEVGEIIDCSIFTPGELINVRGIGVGKGFQGVMKRYNFKGGRASHGSHFHRGPGSIGACAYPGEVDKAKKMPGRMGGKYVNVSNLKVFDIMTDENIMLVKGSVPGKKGSLLYIYQK